MTANVTSVRLTILNAIVAIFQGMQADQPTNDPYGITWSIVALGPLADFDQRKKYSLGVVAGPEKETFSMPYIMCFLTVNVEFRVTANRDDVAPGILAEQALTVVKRAITADRTWGGIAIDTKITGSEIDLTTYADRSVVGVCQATVQYRYSHLDPRDTNPDM
ncbi:MAG: hypothetical protein ACLPN5_04140 [Roseiarcus sp.]